MVHLLDCSGDFVVNSCIWIDSVVDRYRSGVGIRSKSSSVQVVSFIYLIVDHGRNLNGNTIYGILLLCFFLTVLAPQASAYISFKLRINFPSCYLLVVEYLLDCVF